jgi:UDP-glucose 4-epimerase
VRALVTGAAGFIGSSLVDRLLMDGHQVIGVDNLSGGTLVNLEHAFRFNMIRPGLFNLWENDIQAPEMADIVAGSYPDVIFHLAAQVDPLAAVEDPLFDARSNVLGTINLCEASRRAGVRRVIYAASNYAAQLSHPAVNTTPAEPLSLSAVAKLAGEMYLRAYADMYGLAPVCLRFSNVYGPRQNPHGLAGVITRLGSAVVGGQLPDVSEDDVAAVDLIFVDDVVEAFLRLGFAPIEMTGTYHISTGHRTTYQELSRLIAAYLDGSAASPVADHSAGARLVALTEGEAKSELGWTSAVDLTSGIQHTMHWLCGALEPEPSLWASA